MAGLLRNLLTLLRALASRQRHASGQTLVSRFRVMPWDAGIRRLKSDRYLHLAECAQLDFILRCGLGAALLRQGIGFVNAAQLIRFQRPVPLFARIEVHTRVLWLDERWAWFEHGFHSHGQPCACLLVKMKFKQGRHTLPPTRLLHCSSRERPHWLDDWDALLQRMAS